MSPLSRLRERVGVRASVVQRSTPNALTLPYPASGRGESAACARLRSIRKLAKHAIDIAVPLPVEQLELPLRRRLVRLDDLDQRLDEDAFVRAILVEARTPLEPVRGDLHGFDREITHRAAAKRQLQCMLRHAVAQRVTLRIREVPDEIPRRIERSRVVE